MPHSKKCYNDIMVIIIVLATPLLEILRNPMHDSSSMLIEVLLGTESLRCQEQRGTLRKCNHNIELTGNVIILLW